MVFEEGVFYAPNNFTFLKTNIDSLPQYFKIDGNDWRMNIPKGFSLTSSTHTIINGNNGLEAFGNSEGIFYININDDIDNELGSDSEKIFPLLTSFGSKTYSLPINVIRTGNYYPTKIEFKIESGLINTNYRIVTLLILGNFTVTCSNWLYCEILESEEKKIKIRVIDPGVFGTGSYEGFVKVQTTQEIINIPVYLSVGASFDLGIDDSKPIFTHSMDELKFSAENEDSFLNLTINLNSTLKNLNYKIPFFKQKASKNIGLTLSRMLNYELDELESNLPLNYFSLYAKEESENRIVKEFNKENIPVFLGYQPEVRNGRAILQHNKMSRFTKNSTGLVSIASVKGNYQYRIEKNSEIVFQSNIEYGYIKTISFKEYDAKPGDYFDFVLMSDGDELKKRFVIIPDMQQSITVVYIDSFGLHSCINFTGTSKNINTEFNHKIEAYEKGTFLNFRKYTEKETSVLQLNTGFLLKKISR